MLHLIFDYLMEERFYVFIVALAEATADTWATEIGTLANKYPVSIINFKKLNTGQSGGVTTVGSIAALFGAICLSVCGYSVWEIWGYGDSVSIKIISLVIVTGLAGAFFDSILGATIQAQYSCSVCDRITEKKLHCGTKTGHFKGLIYINNDIVNFLSTVFSALLFLAIYRLFYI